MKRSYNFLVEVKLLASYKTNKYWTDNQTQLQDSGYADYYTSVEHECRL